MTIDYSKRGKDEELVVEACLHKPPYRVLASGEDAEKLARTLEETALTFDTYCVFCQRDATFKRTVPRKAPALPVPITAAGPMPMAREIISLSQTVMVYCTRDFGHKYTFMFGPYRDGIAKVGQNPSAFDIAGSDLARFRGVLDQADMRELQQAVMLHTHGAAIGAFVYLRRIFERLLDRHHDEYAKDNGDIEGFDKMRVEERVLELKSVLPEVVVENRKMYGVLSKGIHQLQDEECAALYDLMHAAVVEILERDIYQKQSAETSKGLRAAVAKAAGRFGGSEKG